MSCVSKSGCQEDHIFKQSPHEFRQTVYPLRRTVWMPVKFRFFLSITCRGPVRLSLALLSTFFGCQIPTHRSAPRLYVNIFFRQGVRSLNHLLFLSFRIWAEIIHFLVFLQHSKFLPSYLLQIRFIMPQKVNFLFQFNRFL